MITMCILVMINTWVLGFYELEALGVLIGYLEFSLRIAAHLLCSFLCFFDVIVELHAMDEILFNDFLIGSESEFCT